MMRTVERKLISPSTTSSVMMMKMKMMTMTKMAAKTAKEGTNHTKRRRQGRDHAVEAVAEVAREIVRMAVEGIDVLLSRDLAHQEMLEVAPGLVPQREVERDVPHVREAGQGIARGREKGESFEVLVLGAGLSPVPVPEVVSEREIKGVGAGDLGVGHMTGHVTAGRGPVLGHHTRGGGATALAHGHVIVTVVGDPVKLLRTCVCVSACHSPAQMLPLALWSGNRLTVDCCLAVLGLC